MAKPRSDRSPPPRRRKPAEPPLRPRMPADAVEIRRILGPLDDGQVCRILAFGADTAELQQAAAAIAGDLPGHIGRPLEGPAAQVYDLLIAESFEDTEPRTRPGESTQP